MWFKIDDQFSRHRKVRRLMLEFGGAGKDARLLWEEMGVAIAADNQPDDTRLGVIEAWRIADAAYHCGIKPGRATTAAVAALMAVGLWHDHEGTLDCPHESCSLVVTTPGELCFHDWRDWQMVDKGDAYRQFSDRRKKDLGRAAFGWVVEQVRARDGDRCRYCAERVSWQDRRGDLGATWDHLDPSLGFAQNDTKLANTPRNLVVACRRCNTDKGRRTPDEWVAEGGRPLLPAGTTEAPSTPIRRASTHDGSSPGPTPRARKSGPAPAPRSRGGTGPGPGQDRAQVGARSGGAGQGRVRAGPGQGPGRVGSGRVPP